ncbi:hypothetical protein FE257_012044 [Aspergillus nanangensis]|uniref:Uncharacterized protein n=1 Tax=Aspergillus nanangensis TaxID=2582783 RepID=A0AAD4GQA2_ASPNN|nr:hypothetical protein FE257_012044 [Aspergillus nanangensis]
MRFQATIIILTSLACAISAAVLSQRDCTAFQLTAKLDELTTISLETAQMTENFDGSNPE